MTAAALLFQRAVQYGPVLPGPRVQSWNANAGRAPIGFGWANRVEVTGGAVSDYPPPIDATLRRASHEDAMAVHGLLDHYARAGVLLPRTLGQIDAAIGDFLVAAGPADGGRDHVGHETFGAARKGERVLGGKTGVDGGPRAIDACGALRFHGPALAEVAALAVSEKKLGQGLGRRVVRALINEAALLGVERVFALTLDAGFFHRLGFRTTSIREFPEKMTRDCARCTRRAGCREVAVVHVIDENETNHWRL